MTEIWNPFLVDMDGEKFLWLFLIVIVGKIFLNPFFSEYSLKLSPLPPCCWPVSQEIIPLPNLVPRASVWGRGETRGSPTSFPGSSLLFEERPWLGLVTCLTEIWSPKGE
jgi:hypothetical protein